MGGIYGALAAFILEGSRNGEQRVSGSGWLGSDEWQLGLESLTSKARAHCHLLHSSAELSPPPPVQAFALKDHCPEQNIKLLPNHSPSKTIFSLKSKSKSGRGAGEMTRWQRCLICLQPCLRGDGVTERGVSQRIQRGERREAYWMACVSVCVCVWLYLIEQRQTAGYPVLQFDNSDEVTLLSLILACVAQRQRVILQKKSDRERRRLRRKFETTRISREGLGTHTRTVPLKNKVACISLKLSITGLKVLLSKTNTLKNRFFN